MPAPTEAGWREQREEWEKGYFLSLIAESRGNVRVMAAKAQMNRQYVYKKLRRHGLTTALPREGDSKSVLVRNGYYGKMGSFRQPSGE